MYQREKILRAFEKAGLNKSRKVKVKQFLQYLDDNPQVCWKDAAKEFQDKYLDISNEVVPIILNTNDPLIISNLLKHFDLGDGRNLQNVKTYIQSANAYRQPRLFSHMAKYYSEALGEEINSKIGVPESIRSIVKIQERKRLQLGGGNDKGKIEMFTGSDGQYYFHLVSAKGDILLVSEAYKSKASCQNGIESVKKNAADKVNYLCKTSKDGQSYFVLVAANKKIIGVGKRYASDDMLDLVIESIRRIAPDATVISLG